MVKGVNCGGSLILPAIIFTLLGYRESLVDLANRWSDRVLFQDPSNCKSSRGESSKIIT